MSDHETVQEAADEVPELQPKVTAEDTPDVDPKSRLEDLIAQATAKYAIKDYRSAAELYSRGTELQAEINGEMSTENADLLYQYGRCLYHVAVMNSDVLGTKVAGERVEPSANKVASVENGNSRAVSKTDPTTEELVEAVVADKEDSNTTESAATNSKPFFQFTGDENFDEPDDEDVEGDEEEGGADAVEDDFSNAFEVLDLARVLLERRWKEIQQREEDSGKGKGSSSTSEDERQVKERLSDTYDLQAEISLENEQFPAAANDLRAALDLKKELYPQESSMIAEAHYKLSLALEFSSVTHQKDAEGNDDNAIPPHVDDAMREEAAQEMEAAIASCKLRVAKEQEALSGEQDDAKKLKTAQANIKDVQEMIQDMEQRVTELRQPPVSINDPRGTGSIDGATPLSGILGSILGESPEEQKARLDAATKEATDVSNLVKRKKPAPPAAIAAEAGADAAIVSGKRKAEEVENGGDNEEEKEGGNGEKRAKLE